MDGILPVMASELIGTMMIIFMINPLELGVAYFQTKPFKKSIFCFLIRVKQLIFFPLLPHLPDSQECEKSQRKWQETPLEAALLTSPSHAIAAAENIALNPQDLQTKVAPSRSYQYDSI